MSLLLRLAVLPLPHCLVAPFLPIAAYYFFTFSMFLEGSTTMGMWGLRDYREPWFWKMFVLPATLVILFLGFIFPQNRRAIDWWSLSILFAGLYLLSPRISA